MDKCEAVFDDFVQVDKCEAVFFSLFLFNWVLLLQLTKNQHNASKKLPICCYAVIFSGLMLNPHCN